MSEGYTSKPVSLSPPWVPLGLPEVKHGALATQAGPLAPAVDRPQSRGRLGDHPLRYVAESRLQFPPWSAHKLFLLALPQVACLGWPTR